MKVVKVQQKLFENQTIYVGMDVHKKSWSISVFTKSHSGETFTQEPSVDRLVGHMKKKYPGARFVFVYEAGFSGFWIQRGIEAHAGCTCIVVHPPDIPTSDKERRGKSDTVDARRLARELAAGNLHGLYIPSVEAEEARKLVRTRQELVCKQTRCKNQIRMMLYEFGVSIPEEYATRYWSRRFIAWLEALSFQTESGTLALQAHFHELLFLRQEILLVMRGIRTLSRTERYSRNVELLCSMPGISTLTAMVILTEIVDINRFRTSNQLANYFGVIPGERTSGEKTRQTGISKRRNAHLRHVLIETAWIAVAQDPYYLAKFNHLVVHEHKSKKDAIVIIARKLVNCMLAILVHGERYQVHTAA